MTNSLAAPVSANERIEFLDVLRGVALFGILCVNLPLIALPLAEAMGGDNALEAMTPDAWVAAFVRMLGENKFMALFSTLFGMGLALQIDRAEARGVAPGSFYPRRLLVLAGFGVLNAVLIFFGDILLPYAIAGTVLYLLRKRSPKAMLWIAAGLLAIGIGLSVVFEGLFGGGGSGGGEGAGDDLLAADRALAEGSFVEGSFARGVIYLSWLVLSSMIAFNWRILALFFVGAALLRLGWATREKQALHRRVAVVGLLVGVAFEGASLYLHRRADLTIDLRVVDVLLHQLGGLALSAGYFGAVATWCWSGGLDRLRRAIASTGRMALTNYLGQNIVAGLIFCGHGFALHGSLSHLDVFGVGCAIYAGQVVLSSWWMGRASSGPFERLWRRLTYPRGR
ncbi:MAG: DUF418 domain-containing protein [Planctomycetota bacterium]|nr:DUF418 domain-containing protein [Planctomycetota bacterium]